MEELYKVIELEKFGGKLNISTRKHRSLMDNEILVLVMCSTIHPADLSFLNGTYGQIKPDEMPIVPGFEGSGIIVKVGDNVDKSLLNKRVGLFANSSKLGKFEGLWSQYHYTTPEHVLLFNSNVNYEKIAFSMGNPLTVLGFLKTLKEHNSLSVVQNGASSACGKMLIRLCKKEGIKSINIVRKEEHIQNLLSMGADYVISTSNNNWENEVSRLSSELETKVCFECVGGNWTGLLLSALPDSSTLYHYGNLELRRLGMIDNADFVFRNKKMKGWWLKSMLNSLSDDEKKEWSKAITEDLQHENGIFATDVSKVFQMEEYEKAFEYYLTHMGEGKIIIKFND